MVRVTFLPQPKFRDANGEPAGPVSRKVVRGLRRRAAGTIEDANKAEVRKRDKYCRFPLCGCRQFGLALHVSHRQHKGAGGNPKGDRSEPKRMIYLCAARHRENRVSVDRGAMRAVPLTPAGTAGPCAWEVDVRSLDSAAVAGRPRWVEVARETALHTYEPLTPSQRQLLERLSEMTL